MRTFKNVGKLILNDVENRAGYASHSHLGEQNFARDLIEGFSDIEECAVKGTPTDPTSGAPIKF